MSDTRRFPPDQPARTRIETDFAANFLVEAGAGSGKTHSLAARMAAGIAAGACTVEGMAAVTFTRKAAAELRGRFRLALEERLGKTTSREESTRLEAALTGIERLFAGTIHAFCAHLLRERPVDAGFAPGFVELDDIQNLARQRLAWRDYVNAARGSGFAPMLDLLEAGVKPKDLEDGFARMCDHEDVEFDLGGGTPPAFGPAMKRVEAFWGALSALAPDQFADDTKCPAQQKFDEFGGRLANLRHQRRVAGLASLLDFWGKTKVTMVWWSGHVGRDASFGERARKLVDDFRAEVVEPFLEKWRAYVHGLAMRVLDEARRSYAEARRRENVVNYVDLLKRTATVLRERGDVRRALQQKYRWLFVDEFQDTDPLQAEVFLMLAGDEPVASGTPGTGSSAGVRDGEDAGAELPCDPFALPLRPGALFVVGDPKQSIYRFRRADIDIYTRVRQRIEATGGHTLALTANFRSLPGVCDLANTVFPPLFASLTAPYSPAFEPLQPVRDEAGGPAGPRVAKLTVPTDGTTADQVEREAADIAAFIQGEVAAGRRGYGDFLVLTRQRPRLRVYAEAFDALEIPVEVSGAGLFCESPEVAALALLLAALADPLDPVPLVGVLRGPLFGISDPELFQYRQAGGRFELNVPLPEPKDEKDANALDRRFGPVLPAMRRLRAMLRATKRVPLAAAVEVILEETGFLALGATTPGGARAGHLLQAVDRVREVVEDGGGLADAAGALNEEEESTEAEALPLRPGRPGVVRLMNLHKAKGLEAPVVFLADPGHTFEFPTTHRIVREGAKATGYLKIVKKGDAAWQPKTLGQPLGWDEHEQEEQKYKDAEKLRLLYVAGTRARDLLVVCRLDAEPKKNKAWGPFEGYLATVPELKVPKARRESKRVGPDLSAAARAEAAVERAARHERARRPSWAVVTPTGARTRPVRNGAGVAGGAASETPTAADGAGGGAGAPHDAGGYERAAAAVPVTPSQRVDAGVAWGTLVHGLLEHAMRFPGASRDDLARLANWLTVETMELRPFIPEALDLVEAVSKAPFWQDARAGGEVCVEVPFAVRLEPGQAVPGVAAVERPTVLRGIIDLAHGAEGGWRIVDYKTDQIDGVADVEAELLARHGAQLGQYEFAWERVTGGKVVSARIVSVRAAQPTPL
jgi:ATP-dependent helicase/nuclease subunit A